MELGKIQLNGTIREVQKIRTNQNGKKFLEFSIEETFSRKVRKISSNWTKKTQIHKVRAYNQKAETLYKTLKKGNRLFVSGVMNSIDGCESKDKKRKSIVINLQKVKVAA